MISGNQKQIRICLQDLSPCLQLVRVCRLAACANIVLLRGEIGGLQSGELGRLQAFDKK